MRANRFFPRKASLFFLLALAVLPRAAAAGDAAVDIHARLDALARQRFLESDLQARIADGRLATLYVQLKNQRQWAQALQPFAYDTSAAQAAVDNLQTSLDGIQAFYTRYIRQPRLGDEAVYRAPQVIVILGANRKTLEQRLAFALPLIRRFPDVPLVLSGGGRTIALEAGIMRDFLSRNGIAGNRLILETDSLDTVGNAVFTRFALATQRIDSKRILLVTSDFHAPRSLLLFQRILGPSYRFAAALAPYDGSDLPARIDSELTQSAASQQDLLQWAALPGQRDGTPVRESCDVFFQMLLQHKLYDARWDLARHYAPLCNLRAPVPSAN